MPFSVAEKLSIRIGPKNPKNHAIQHAWRALWSAGSAMTHTKGTAPCVRDSRCPQVEQAVCVQSCSNRSTIWSLARFRELLFSSSGFKCVGLKFSAIVQNSVDVCRNKEPNTSRRSVLTSYYSISNQLGIFTTPTARYQSDAPMTCMLECPLV